MAKLNEPEDPRDPREPDEGTRAPAASSAPRSAPSSSGRRGAETNASPTSPSSPSSMHDDDEIPPWARRDRFAVSLLVVVAVAVIAANVLGSLLGPGWIGVGSERAVNRWLWCGGATSIAAAVLGIATIVSLVIAAVPSPRTSIGSRLVATFGAGLVVALGAAALGNPAENEVLLVLAGGALWVLVVGAVEALAPPRTRALGLQLALLALAAIARVGGWALTWSASRRGHPGLLAYARVSATVATVAELSAALILLMYLVYRPGLRAALSSALLLAAAFAVTTWIVRTPTSESGTLRDALQHALSLRVQGTGIMPTWIAAADASAEIKMIAPDHRYTFVPLVFAELLSIALAVSALVGARRGDLPLFAAMALAALSRGQLDTPLRAIAVTVAAMSAIVLARGARLTPPLSSWNELRPPNQD